MKNKTIKKGGAAKTTTKKLTASQRRGFDPNNLDEKSKGFLDLFNLPRRTANDKNTFLNNINNYDCTGCNLQGSVFSQKNLSYAKLANANLTNTLFNGANTKVTGAILTGANFTNSSIKNANFNNVNLEDAKFKNSNLYEAKFINANFENCEFIETTINNLELQDAQLNNIVMINCTILKNNFKSANNSISNSIFDESTFNKCTFNNLTLNNCDFLESTFNNLCEIMETNLNNVRFSKSIFIKSLIKDCNIDTSDFSYFNGYISDYKDVHFTGCNFTNSDCRLSIFYSCKFTNCNLSNSNWRDVFFITGTQKLFNDCNLTNIDLQSAKGLNGMDFEGVNLQGAQLKGIDLRGTNFRNANLRGATFEFSDVEGANFEGANLEGAVLVGVAENWQQALNLPRNARRNRAQDTHLAFNDIDFQDLLKFFEKNKIPIKTEITNEEFVKFISHNLKQYLDKLESQEKEKLTERLDGCIKGRLDTWNYSDNLPGVEPTITWKELIYPMIQYVNKQSTTFKDLYIQILITDSAEGHGQSFSCIKGIVERLLTTTGKVVEVLIDNETSKKKEYTELHLILSPPFTMSTLFKEWLEIHKEGGDDPLDENDDPEKLTNSFLEYAKEQYNFDEKNDIEKKIILNKICNDNKVGINKLYSHNKICNDDIVGINKIENQFGKLYFFGGKRRKNKKSKKYKPFKKRNTKKKINK